jgi:lysophospholipase L1-like esterase
MQGMVDHPLLGYAHPKSVAYRLGKNRVSLNSNGHRNDDMPVAKPAGERRILVLGDSVTFGWGVDQGEDFPARLEALLRQQDNRVWRVINSGVNGYNSEQEAIYFASEGIAFEPDIVLLVYVANDADPAFDPKSVTWRRYPAWPSSLPELLDRARSVSYLYQTTRLFRGMKELEMTATASPPQSITRHARWPDSLRALRIISDLCRIHGIPFLLATEFGSDAEFFLAMKEREIDAVSLGPAWEKVPPGQQHVSRVDPHPTARGHIEVANWLLEQIRNRGWLETKGAP